MKLIFSDSKNLIGIMGEPNRLEQSQIENQIFTQTQKKVNGFLQKILLIHHRAARRAVAAG